MDHYLDIRLRPDPDFTPPQLMSALYSKLHRALVAGQHDAIGVSFPLMEQQRAGLGGVLRLHGSATALDQLMSQPWLSGMHDHVERSALLPVPADAKHRTLRRVQAQSNPERLRRRLAKRHQLSEAEARERIPDSAAQQLKLPYLQLRSHSTGQHFRLFLQLSAEQATPLTGTFNRYGLSQTASLPWF
ncbi:type I-F CRISPR-associated endoribonuclease Cas6/Csy4 [Pokkaliibacter plantistimulans]|uniref:Type I-F CRISPR-associated endoribonuclease Cas6/Csy4 n=1 Tax=Proteobacteria bacterium 228 TaxID=2083153 RepID=A0A2S5KID8_9PROT|nr:type I-F CRISPR-associated endoribonuclease Cas6/Csy4 [Pokkaliibacter plantistimulans]PPC74540.1 type I-F CRISPR-associated endoribonuclease Cas6/Csy4 [Pokkaliibacter plantistimulans]